MVKMIPCRALRLALVLAFVLTSFSIRGYAQTPIPEDPHLRDAVENEFSRFEPSPVRVAPMEVQSTGAARLPWSKVVFQSYRDKNYEIYIADDDGGSLARLTNNSKSDIQPRLNPGGTKIAYASNTPGTYDIYSMNPNGTGIARLTNNTKDDSNPRWSPDSSKILFQSYRDGNWEIYVMNANGTGQIRLTYDAGYDGEPSWSPDGTKIAWSAYRNGQYRIWIMNANGTGAVQLSNQAWSENASFSPDGSQIAFDADGNGDTWYEVWLMNADGSNQHLVYATPSGSTQDAFVRGWSPDGSWITYTHVYDIYYNGSWYWTDSYLKIVSATQSPAVETDLLGTNMDWLPDWQTLDTQAPTCSMPALPVQTPSPFAFTWNGSDTGGSGLKNYDIQLRDGTSGAWMDWLPGTTLTASGLAGVGGHSYFFRCRARDNAFNVSAWSADNNVMTTVEAQVPVTWVHHLPSLTHNEFDISWEGYDLGGSGITGYDIQVRDMATPDWTNWLTKTPDTSAKFSGLTGHQYFFRSRGIDAATNTEGWPAGDGDICTTLYYWQLSGTVLDNREIPVASANAIIETYGFLNVPSDNNGRYNTYASQKEAGQPFTVTWEKSGYESAPATQYNVDSPDDSEQDIILTPGGNLVSDGNFEQGDLSTGPWTSGGEAQPSLAQKPHTGEYSALLARQENTVAPSTQLSYAGYREYYAYTFIAAGPTGDIHVVFQHGWTFKYMHKPKDGDWSVAWVIASAYEPPQAALDSGNNLHLVWHSDGNLYYTRRDNTGYWSAPIQIASANGSEILFVSSDNSLNLAWGAIINNQQDIFYAWRANDGTWSSPQNISGDDADSSSPTMAEDGTGKIHLAWQKNTSGNSEIYYSGQVNATEWSPPMRLTDPLTSSVSPQIAAEGEGNLHLVWADVTAGINLKYLHRTSTGTWSALQSISSTYQELHRYKIALQTDGTLHVVWTDDFTNPSPNQVLYNRRSSDGIWSGIENTGLKSEEYGDIQMLVDGHGALHIFTEWGPGYVRRETDGSWSTPRGVEDTTKVAYFPKMAIDPSGIVHFFYEFDYYWNSELRYTHTLLPLTDANSTISQVITLPDAMQAPTLSIMYLMADASAAGGPQFSLKVTSGAKTDTLYATDHDMPQWKHLWFDLSPYKGQTITLSFTIHEVAGRPNAAVYIDEVSIASAYPDVWIQTIGWPTSALRGSTIQQTIFYGNRSSVPASGVTLTATLPDKLTFVSADLAPTSIEGQVLTWDIGDLAGNSGPFAIHVTAAIAEDTVLFSTINGSAQIQTISAELELGNNTVPTLIFIGTKTYIPITRK